MTFNGFFGKSMCIVYQCNNGQGMEYNELINLMLEIWKHSAILKQKFGSLLEVLVAITVVPHNQAHGQTH